MEGPTSKKRNEPPERVNLKGNIKIPNPLPLQEAYQIRKGDDLLKGCDPKHNQGTQKDCLILYSLDLSFKHLET